MIPRLQWWISSLFYVHFKVTGALWHLWHGTLRTHALLELRLGWGIWTFWLQPLFLPGRSQRSGCSQEWPVQYTHEAPQQLGTGKRHIWFLSFSPPNYFLLAGCNWRHKRLKLEERKPTDQFRASNTSLFDIPSPWLLADCYSAYAPSVSEHQNNDPAQ